MFPNNTRTKLKQKLILASTDIHKQKVLLSNNTLQSYFYSYLYNIPYTNQNTMVIKQGKLW